jgi:hypothetical protein
VPGEDLRPLDPAAPTRFTIDAPAPEPAVGCVALELSRPSNGRELIEHTRNGHGELTVDNGSSEDAVAVLVDARTGKTFRAMYIRAGTTAKMLEVDPGQYRLQFAHGQYWDAESWSFCEPAGISEFEETLDFS